MNYSSFYWSQQIERRAPVDVPAVLAELQTSDVVGIDPKSVVDRRKLQGGENIVGPQARLVDVIRGGEPKKIPDVELVFGDILFVEPPNPDDEDSNTKAASGGGDNDCGSSKSGFIPADCCLLRRLSGEPFKVDESDVTGEPDLLTVSAPGSVVLSGSRVSRGSAKLLVLLAGPGCLAAACYASMEAAAEEEDGEPDPADVKLAEDLEKVGIVSKVVGKEPIPAPFTMMMQLRPVVRVMVEAVDASSADAVAALCAMGVEVVLASTEDAASATAAAAAAGMLPQQESADGGAADINKKGQRVIAADQIEDAELDLAPVRVVHSCKAGVERPVLLERLFREFSLICAVVSGGSTTSARELVAASPLSFCPGNGSKIAQDNAAFILSAAGEEGADAVPPLQQVAKFVELISPEKLAQ